MCTVHDWLHIRALTPPYAHISVCVDINLQNACKRLWSDCVRRDSGPGAHADTALRAQVREAAEGGSEGRLFMAVDKELVAERVGELLKKQDLSKYVL